ncbi:hypothetical protein CEXT_370031 [Caerostris extrusa]|uniref:Secreted protein n=1 Tax=Caerostris extrusa TaxID=172846 RepID=A0AAV4VI91_CAEEX|nr:hypothetical protein CEXT_370031 [Caerostris extrusa]
MRKSVNCLVLILSLSKGHQLRTVSEINSRWILRLRSPRMETGSRPIEAWNDVSYDAVRAHAYKRLWMGDRGFLTETGRWRHSN